MKYREELEATIWVIASIVVIAGLCLLMQGCGEEQEVRSQQTANSAATIYEAAEAINVGVSPASPVSAIKSNASAIALVSGHEYPSTNPSVPSTAKPAATVAQWQEDTPKALEAGHKQAGDTTSLGPPKSYWAEIAGGSVVALGVVGSIIKCLSPGNPLVGLVGNGIDALRLAIMPAGVKRKEEKETVFANGGLAMIKVIESMSNNHTVKDLKNKFLAKLPSEVIDAINAEVERLNSTSLNSSNSSNSSPGTIAAQPKSQIDRTTEDHA